ncbi:HAD-like domain-containing protein [Dunaliella salina]|uniref:HAD-like domain-containing protein n=1 Tax=Dunaliella salina TaxID=3046 RepID=A0ABQ7GQG5_DUNSA|nr:HAD-like domain-containing protein [Dunaliella salina]|eukprot:KAF5836768.1 HAD-like domain-containing protein [Dunaliella salina]
MGFTSSHFTGAVTSGELAHRELQSRPDQWWAGLGHRCIHTTWSSRGSISLEGLGLQIVREPQEASFILAHGTEALSVPSDGGRIEVIEQSLEQLFDLLERCAALLEPPPMVVANPDMVTTSGAELIPMPGTLAKKYADLNPKCQVRLCGKPDPIIYNACKDALGLHPSEVLAVGDSLEHDIAGAAAAGIDSLFIAGGIHQKEVCKGNTGSVDMDALEALSRQHQAVPTYVVPELRW